MEFMITRRAFAGGLALLSTLSPALAEDKLSLDALSAYLNTIQTAQSEFTQFNEDGSKSTGMLYIKRPGRMRFEYAPPNSGVVIAGSGAVILHDKKSNQPPETYPLKRTPLNLILARKVDLGQAKMVMSHSFDGTFTVVRAQDPKDPEIGFIDLMFSANPIALKQWVITNEQGTRTAVVLNGLTPGVTLPDSMFQTTVSGRSSNR
ncbi:outer membrane lipoprotein carrier protein LolA [Seohaeicola nanhaiensis]|uniref:Outer membrane lipoprotein carrier protein LolA n=1 Tax=Seohaeicola nanhaiensis TaxID=1387282 RepID=A0ABV9KHD4_9RHOB